MEKFIKILDDLGYSYQIENGKTIVNHQGSVYLRSLTTLPEGIQFNNQGYVDLESLTTLPEGIQFNNQGYVYLESLTTLPEGIQFNNQGYVDLRSLTTLPEGIQFNNQGYVDLRSLTETPDGLTIRMIDGYAMIIQSNKTVGDYEIMMTEYLGMNHLENKKRFVASKGEFFAHGEDLKSAIADCEFKFMQQNTDKSDIVREINRTGIVTVNQYRLLTGACKAGCQDFLSSKNITADKMPLEEVKTLVQGEYGGQVFNRFFED